MRMYFWHNLADPYSAYFWLRTYLAFRLLARKQDISTTKKENVTYRSHELHVSCSTYTVRFKNQTSNKNSATFHTFLFIQQLFLGSFSISTRSNIERVQKQWQHCVCSEYTHLLNEKCACSVVTAWILMQFDFVELLL